MGENGPDSQEDQSRTPSGPSALRAYSPRGMAAVGAAIG